MNSRRTQRSFILKLFGDPEQYAYKLANDTFADKLPIQMNWLWHRSYGMFRSVSLDQKRQRVWLGNNVKQHLNHAYYIFHNSTLSIFYYSIVPETNQVQHY